MVHGGADASGAGAGRCGGPLRVRLKISVSKSRVPGATAGLPSSALAYRRVLPQWMQRLFRDGP